MESSKSIPKRVFINRLDLFASRHIAKMLNDLKGDGSDENTSEDLEEESETEQTESVGFQIVGTVSEQSDKSWPFLWEQYFQLTRTELLTKLLACDVIIYNVSQHADEVDEAFWAVSALHDGMAHFFDPKIFILISTVMTWACSKTPDPEHTEPLTDENFTSRKAHPDFKAHIELEKKVVKLGKTDPALFSTYVVASGHQYGIGEQIFHYYFKTSWIGEESEIPIFGEGDNFVPTIHISDLARVIQNVILVRPAPQYLLAVDGSSCTMGDIVKAIANELGPAKTCNKPLEEAFLIKSLSAMEMNFMRVNLQMSAVHIEKLFSMNWLCKSGLVENIAMVVKEYREERELLPIRICVLGPPAVGKSKLSRAICKHFKLHHVSLKDSELTCQDGVDLASNPDNSRDQDEDLDDLLMNLHKKLQSTPCKNQGFVLDGFPETYDQAREFFDAVDDDAPSIVPEFVVCLDASDDFLTDRVINLPESEVQKLNYEPDRFLKQLAKYRKNMDAEPVANFFLEMDMEPLQFEITSNSKPFWLALQQRVYDIVGPPKNYSSFTREAEEEEERKALEIVKREAQEKEEEERWQEEETRSREVRWKEWTAEQEILRQQEEETLEVQSLTMKNYLLQSVMPTLTDGLVECCKLKPENPVDFVAEYLLLNNPSNY